MTLSMCLMIFSKFSAPNAVPAAQICPVIIAEAKEASVDSYLVAKIILVESKGVETAYNSNSQDYGIMQIHLATARKFGFTESCVKSWPCNIRIGAFILGDMLRHKGTDCSYNVGSHYKTKMISCLRYREKLATIN